MEKIWATLQDYLSTCLTCYKKCINQELGIYHALTVKEATLLVTLPKVLLTMTKYEPALVFWVLVMVNDALVPLRKGGVVLKNYR